MPGNPWVKLHNDVLGDPKLLRAARKGARHLELLPWLLVFANAADDDGRLTIGGEPAEAEDIAPLIPGASVRAVKSCMISLESVGILVPDDDGTLAFLSWARRTGAPSDHPDRVKERVTRHRLKKRAAQVPDNSTTSENETALHARFSVTTRNETEEEEEKEKDEDAPVVGEQPVTATTPATALELIVAANQGLADNARIADADRQRPWTANQGVPLAQHLAEAAVPRDFARAAMLEQAKACAIRPNTPKYFARAVVEAWERHAAVRDATNTPRPDPVPSGSANGNGWHPPPARPDRKVEAMEKLNAIRTLIRENRTPGNGITRFIPRADVQQLGPQVERAYELVGGADRILTTTPEKFDFLLRDFTRAYEQAGASLTTSRP